MTKFTAKVLTFAVSASALMFQFGGGCGQFWGDVLGDALWLNGID